MLIFDTLSFLETYSSVIPHMGDVINALDHSKPYEESNGKYHVGEIDYIVSAHLSSESGFSGENFDNYILEITLEGEEIVSIEDSVFKLSPGRFLFYDGREKIKRGVMYSTPVAFKSVRFLL